MSEEKKGGLIELLKNISVPDIVKNNAIKALAKGIGSIITSVSDIPVAYFEQQSKFIRAKSDGKILLINAAAESAVNKFKTDSELANRALFYFGKTIVEQQINREQIAYKTIENIQNSSNYYTETIKEIDEDWLTQFWTLAESKTKEDIQEILSKILKKEIINPGSISPNTIQILSLLTSETGNAFNRICNLSIDDGTSCYIIHPNTFAFQNIGPLDSFDISYEDLFDLDDAGLIRSAETLMVNYSKNENQEFEEVNYAGKSVKIDVSEKQLNLLYLTKSGRELRNLLQLTENKIYTKKLKTIFKEKFQE